MKLRSLAYFVAAFLASASAAFAQTYILDDFGTGNATGGVVAASSWNTQLSQTGTTLIVGGTSVSDSGWQAINLTLPDLSLYNYVVLTAQLSASNAAPNIFVTFDDGSTVQTVTILASSLSTASMTTVYVPIAWTINTTTVEAWNIGGGYAAPGTGSPAFRMTFDNLSLSATGAPIPEPATYAAIAGVMALGAVAYRRRQQAA